MEICVNSHDIQTPLHQRPPKHLKTKALAAVAIALVVVCWGVTSRAREKTALITLTQEQIVPTVKTTSPLSQGAGIALTLPATLQAYYSASVYARVSGYLKHWSVDIGAPVKSGQELADIETPELDQQFCKQAEANLDTGASQRAPD